MQLVDAWMLLRVVDIPGEEVKMESIDLPLRCLPQVLCRQDMGIVSLKLFVVD